MADDKSVNMQKWGIPEDDNIAAEVTLLERLVWVPYNEHWWPALLYRDYSELQDHLYQELDVVTKAQFASAIMRQLNDPRPIKIARLLGRRVLEVVEVEEKEYAEFYWQLPKVLPMACRKSKYGKDTKRYLDFHRALDEVEEIIRDISHNSFNLASRDDKKTWLQRAEEALATPYITSSIPKETSSVSGASRNSIQLGPNWQQKEAEDEEGYNFLFKALDGMMDHCNTTYDCVAGSPVEENVEEEEAPRTLIINKPHMMAIHKQRETRESLRKALAQQRQIREGGSVACIADEERDGSMTRTPSTEVLPSPSTDDSALWRLLNSGDEEPEHTVEMPVAPKKMLVQPAQSHTYTRPQEPIDSREEPTEDDREAIVAAARAAAAVELDVTFWDHLTCRAMEY